MIPGLKRFFLAGLCCLPCGCSTTSSGPVAITKVNPYHLQPGPIIRTEDRMIEFEQKRHLYGAVENAELRERYGNHFSVFWKTESRAPVTVRLEYRLGRTGLLVHSQEVVVSSPKHSNVTHFEVTGETYREKGKVTQWKASILQGGSVVAEYKSYLWQ